MKLAIAQTLSLPFAYNSPVMVLDFDLGDKNSNKITGRFKDAFRPRVFSFEITRKSVVYKPFVARTDSTGLNVEAWEDFSLGYSFRIDAGGARREKAQCVKPTSYNCGSICINIKKSCRANADDDFSEERIGKLLDLRRQYLDQAFANNVLPEKEKEMRDKAWSISEILEPYFKEQQRLTDEHNARLEIEKQEMGRKREEARKPLLIEAKEKRGKLLELYDELFANKYKLSPNFLTTTTSAIAKDADPSRRLFDAFIDGKLALPDIEKTPIDEYRLLTEKVSRDFDEARKVVDITLDKARQLLEVEEPGRIKAVFNLDASKTKEIEAQNKGINIFSNMFSASVTTGILNVNETKEKRSFYRNSDNSINMSTDDIGVIVHECGHWLESQNKDISADIRLFYNRRTTGEKIKKLSEVTGNKNYGNNERTMVDKFISPYMGKICDSGSSEVLSMGLELMYRNPIYLAKNDPEMFDFIYSVVRQGN